MKHKDPEIKVFTNFEDYNAYLVTFEDSEYFIDEEEELQDIYEMCMDGTWDVIIEEEPHQAKGEIFLEIFQSAAGV